MLRDVALDRELLSWHVSWLESSPPSFRTHHPNPSNQTQSTHSLIRPSTFQNFTLTFQKCAQLQHRSAQWPNEVLMGAGCTVGITRSLRLGVGDVGVRVNDSRNLLKGQWM